VVGIFDWDSVVAISEPALVGHTAAIFTANWADHSMEPLPTTGESRAFAIDYESFQEHPFTETEWRTADAAHLYAVAYGARCEHSDVTLGLVPDRGPREGWRGLLRARGEDQALAL